LLLIGPLRAGEIEDLRLGDRAFLRNDYPQALHFYRQALSDNPQSQTALFSLGVTYTRLGRYPQARDAFIKVLAQDPNSAPACNNLGWVYLALGRTDLALQWLTQALSLQPDYPMASNNLGIAYLRNRNPWMASQVYLSLQAKDPANPVYLNNLGIACFLLGDYASAERWFTSGLATSPRPENYLNLALLYARNLYPGKAQAMLNQGLKRYPQSRALQGFQAQLDYNSGAGQKAYREWMTILSRDPANPWALSGMAAFYLRKGDVASALPYVKTLSRVDSANYRLQEVLGWMYYFTGKITPAVQQWRMVNRQYPASPLSNYGLGLTSLAKDPKAAFMNLFQALEIYPNWVDARYQLARCYAKLGNKPQALRELDKIKTVNPAYWSKLKKSQEVKSWSK